MRPEAIQGRADRIRLKRKDLARLAGLSQMTIGRTLNGDTSPILSTLDRIEEALVAEEISLRDYLLSLHPRREEAA